VSADARSRDEKPRGRRMCDACYTPPAGWDGLCGPCFRKARAAGVLDDVASTPRDPVMARLRAAHLEPAPPAAVVPFDLPPADSAASPPAPPPAPPSCTGVEGSGDEQREPTEAAPTAPRAAPLLLVVPIPPPLLEVRVPHPDLVVDLNASPGRCRILGCSSPARTRGLCTKGYQLAHRTGVLTTVALPATSAADAGRMAHAESVEPYRELAQADAGRMAHAESVEPYRELAQASTADPGAEELVTLRRELVEERRRTQAADERLTAFRYALLTALGAPEGNADTNSALITQVVALADLDEQVRAALGLSAQDDDSEVLLAIARLLGGAATRPAVLSADELRRRVQLLDDAEDAEDEIAQLEKQLDDRRAERDRLRREAMGVADAAQA